ncbi:hypothetical protein [Falsiroseomonas sp.]|uniref:hypothetical protein n=1 Tax=Falsiroseomonas sp. TaxID=2870721 RepID=UPI003F7097A5
MSGAPETTPDPIPASAAGDAQSRSGILVGNLGEPIRLTGVNLCGFSAEAARGSDTVKVWTKLALTSDEALFHRLAENLDGALTHLVQQAGQGLNLARTSTVLLVARPDDTADLWVDTAAVALDVRVKRAMLAGTVVFENDIADVTAMRFPLVEIGPRDRVLCLFREAWRFALCFDFNPDGALSLDDFERTLGTLFRKLRYRHLYDIVADAAVFGRLVEAGWFPFAEIVGAEFKALANAAEAAFSFDEAERELLAKFDAARLERMFDRRISNPHFKPKERILRSAVNAFKADDPIAVLKIILTEIEGILASAHRAATGRGAKLPALLEFAVQAAEQKAGGGDTLFLPAAFARYLKAHTFASFDPLTGAGSSVSRHAVGHGAAEAEAYTQTRALQALLTLDQIAFGI